jgi:(1->4)-alpha-D-glucan 1-alpha-D-glucosylmutase
VKASENRGSSEHHRTLGGTHPHSNATVGTPRRPTADRRRGPLNSTERAIQAAVAPVASAKVAPVDRRLVPKTALDRLAESYGVQLEFKDGWGNVQPVQKDTIRRLISAMIGQPLDTDAQVQAALEAHEKKVWLSPLPPVEVVSKTAPVVTIRVPVAAENDRLRWTIDGRSGEFRPADLKVVGEATVDKKRIRQYALPLGIALESGNHDLAITKCKRSAQRAQPAEPEARTCSERIPEAEAKIASTRVIATPDTCYVPECLCGDKRRWGVSIQLYALRSERNWGMGDFTDLKNLTDIVGRRGAALIGLNPLHAAFLHNADQCSPYSASSKLFINPLYLDPLAMDDFAHSKEAQAIVNAPAFEEKLTALRTSARIDYQGVSAAKLPVFEACYATFRARVEGGEVDRRAFDAFVRQKGDHLVEFARFEALREHFAKIQPDQPHWGAWPPEYQDPKSPAVEAFAKAHADRVEYYAWLQWQSELQLTGAESHGKDAGLELGFYRDLAVGTDRYSADTWAQKDIYALSLSVGAPADPGNPLQNWGLPPRLPEPMQEDQYRAFGAELDQNMPSGGVLRGDHAFQWQRLYCIPSGPDVKEGAYVSYPRTELLGMLALESEKNRTLVIAEDLGTSPPGFSDELMQRKILSYRLLRGAKDANGYKSPKDYPQMAVVAAGNHDTPTLAGWWSGFDLEWGKKLGRLPDDAAYEKAVAKRQKEKRDLVEALAKEHLLPRGLGTKDQIARLHEIPESLSIAIHAFLGRTPSKLVMVQLEDVIGMTQGANIPGTVNEHPNWRVPLATTLEALDRNPRLDAFASALKKRRAG